jgi:hypothetical protein
MALNKEQSDKYGEALLKLLPTDGTPKGNISLIQEFLKR